MPRNLGSLSLRNASANNPAQLDLPCNPITGRYRTVINPNLSPAPNFAGLLSWPTSSPVQPVRSFAVVNLKTGRANTASDVNSVSDVHFAADDFLQNRQ